MKITKREPRAIKRECYTVLEIRHWIQHTTINYQQASKYFDTFNLNTYITKYIILGCKKWRIIGNVHMNLKENINIIIKFTAIVFLSNSCTALFSILCTRTLWFMSIIICHLIQLTLSIKVLIVTHLCYGPLGEACGLLQLISTCHEQHHMYYMRFIHNSNCTLLIHIICHMHIYMQ